MHSFTRVSIKAQCSRDEHASMALIWAKNRTTNLIGRRAAASDWSAALCFARVARTLLSISMSNTALRWFARILWKSGLNPSIWAARSAIATLDSRPSTLSFFSRSPNPRRNAARWAEGRVQRQGQKAADAGQEEQKQEEWLGTKWVFRTNT